MIKIMDDTLSLTNLVSDSTNGLGQIEPTSFFADRELNGIDELTFTSLVTDKHFSDLKVGGIVKAKVDDNRGEQLFRIYFISKAINNEVEVRCQHITYDLTKVVVSPFQATGATLVKDNMVSHIIGSYPFTMSTDISNTASTFKLDIPRSFRECLGGYEGSLLDVFRGEYLFDNLNVGMNTRLGSDNGVRISYGKNLTDFRQEENNESVYTSVIGFATVDDVTYVGNVYHKVASTYPKVKIVDFSSDYESGDVPTTAELTTKATTYAANNDIEVPNVNLTISFVPLYQTEEYRNIAPLERVSLGDTVHVFFEKLNVEASARVIKTRWNGLLEKYDEIELGSAKSNLNSIINDAVDSAKSDILSAIDIDTSEFDEKMDTLSQLITNGLGLYFTKQALISGGYRYIIHNQPLLAQSDVQYYMSASGIMVSNDYGQTWQAGYDISTGTLLTQALSAITLEALSIYGSTIRGSQIIFGDPSDQYITAQAYEDGQGNEGILFDGTGHILFRPIGSFDVRNYNTNLLERNRFRIFHSSTTSTSYLDNFVVYNGAELRANRFYMSADSSTRSIELYNQNDTGSSYANRMQLVRTSTYNAIYLYNYFFNQTYTSNALSMSSNATENDVQLGNGYIANKGGYSNYLRLHTETNLNTLRLENYNPSGTRINYLEMNAGSNNSFYIGTNDDIELIAGDTIRLRATDKVRIYGDLYINGTDKVLVDSNGHLYIDTK